MNDALCSQCFGRIDCETCICVLSEKMLEFLNQFGADWYISDIKYGFENSDTIKVEPMAPIEFTHTLGNTITIESNKCK